jgi:hypothetical protein
VLVFTSLTHCELIPLLILDYVHDDFNIKHKAAIIGQVYAPVLRIKQARSARKSLKSQKIGVYYTSTVCD